MRVTIISITTKPIGFVVKLYENVSERKAIDK